MGARPVRRLRLIATNLDWQLGPEHGPVLEGPIEELLMVLCGRPADRSQLDGPGLAAIPVPA